MTCSNIFSSDWTSLVVGSSCLYGDAGLDPLLAQVALCRDVAVVWGGGQQEDGREDVVAARNCDDTEQEQDLPLEGAPGAQERH